MNLQDVDKASSKTIEVDRILIFIALLVFRNFNSFPKNMKDEFFFKI